MELSVEDFSNYDGKRNYVNSLPYMGSSIPAILVSLIYIRFVFYEGPRFMKSRQPWKLTTFIRCYNVYQVMACSYIIWKCYEYGFSYTRTFLSCDNIEPEKFKNVADLYWWFMMLRVSEYIETVTFVLRKKTNQVSFLHVYHHVAVVVLGWVIFTYVFHWVIFIAIVLNSMIHVMMYMYYFMSSFSEFRPIGSKLKPYMTGIQIVQLLVIFARTCTALFQPECNYEPKYFAMAFGFNALLIALFFNFFIQAYLKKRKASKEETNKLK